MSDSMLLKNVHVIPMDRCRVMRNYFVYIQNGIVVKIGPMKRLRVFDRKDILTFDGRGKYIMPGLYDMHAHVRTSFLRKQFLSLFLAHGITAVRETGNNGNTFKLKRDIEKRKIIGPRLFVCGSIFEGAQPLWKNFSKRVSSTAEARKLVRLFKKKGADFIKVYHTLSPDIWRTIIKEAHRVHLKVTGHIPEALDAFDAIGAGQDGIEHIEYCGWSVFQSIYQGARLVDILEVKTRTARLLKSLRNKKLGICPTLIVGEQMSKLTRYADLLKMKEARYLPKHYRTKYWNPRYENASANIRSVPVIRFQNRQKQNKKMRTLVPRLQKAGVLLLAGSDTANPFVVPGHSLLQELELLVKAGLTPFEALSAATRNAAEFLKASPMLGTIAKGKIANLVLLRRNPLQRISNARTIESVILDGKYFQRNKLFKKVKIYQ